MVNRDIFTDNDNEDVGDRLILLSSIQVDVTVLEGRNLMAKRKKLLTRKWTSNPYVKILVGQVEHRTIVKKDTLNPKWDQKFVIDIPGEEANQIIRNYEDSTMNMLKFHICDERTNDESAGNNNNIPMGTVTVPLPIKQEPTTKWYRVENGSGENRCNNASGELLIKIAVSAKKIPALFPGNTLFLRGGRLRVSLGWDFVKGQDKLTKLDASCVAIDCSGNLILHESVYYGNLINSNGSILHHHNGNPLGTDDAKERIDINLDDISPNVRALYFLLTMTSSSTFADVESIFAYIYNLTEGETIGRFSPNHLEKDHTALFLLRFSRSSTYYGWNISIIGETESCARDFGSLFPEIKSYSRDIVPGIHISTHERLAVMRKGRVIRLQDYTLTKEPPDTVVMGISWNTINNCNGNIDLGASAICFDSNFHELDIINFKRRVSTDHCILHNGNDRKKATAKNLERITVELNRVNEYISHIIFTITSFSGQDFNTISNIHCHLLDVTTQRDLAKYSLSNHNVIRHLSNPSYKKEQSFSTTALTICSLSRNPHHGWILRIISLPGNGKVARDLIPSIQAYLQEYPEPAPDHPPDPDSVVTAMPPEVPMEPTELLVVSEDYDNALKSYRNNNSEGSSAEGEMSTVNPPSNGVHLPVAHNTGVIVEQNVFSGLYNPQNLHSFQMQQVEAIPIASPAQPCVSASESNSSSVNEPIAFAQSISNYSDQDIRADIITSPSPQSTQSSISQLYHNNNNNNIMTSNSFNSNAFVHSGSGLRSNSFDPAHHNSNISATSSFPSPQPISRVSRSRSCSNDVPNNNRLSSRTNQPTVQIPNHHRQSGEVYIPELT